MLCRYDKKRVTEEENHFWLVHMQEPDKLSRVINDFYSVDGEYAIIVSCGQASFDADMTNTESFENMDSFLEAIGKQISDLFGGESIVVTKKVADSTAIIYFERMVNVSRIPLTKSWVSVTMVYYSDKTAPDIQELIRLHGEHMKWQDQHYAVFSHGLV